MPLPSMNMEGTPNALSRWTSGDGDPERGYISGNGAEDDRATRQSQEVNNNKRRRVALACDRCRAKKSRCDGAQPICSMCRAGGYECIYRMPAAGTKSALSPESQSETTRRFQEMEDRLRNFERLLSSRGQGSSETPVVRRERDSIIAKEATEPTSLQFAISPNPVPSSLNESFTEGGEKNSMGILAFADEEVSGFFGPSSNIALIRHVSSAIATTRDPSFSNAKLSSEIDNALMVSRPQTKKLQNWIKAASCKLYALPPEPQVMELAKDYFSNTGFLFPYVHSDTFFETYAQMKGEQFKNVRVSWLALFNTILANAMCSRTDDRLSFDDRVSASEVFYQRAVGLSNLQNMQGTSLEMVQYLLLMTQYLQGSQRTIQTYAVHGQAVKSAFQIGLQSEEVSKRLPPLEREARKRTWYACILIDRTLSVTFGRPSSIPDRYIKMDLPQQIDEWTTRSCPTLDPTLSISFYNATIGLYRIMWNTLDLLYNQNIGDFSSPCEETASMIRHVVVFEQQLEAWVSGLPISLKPVPLNWPGGPSHAARLRTIISLRYYNLRCLIHRPVVMTLLDNAGKAYPSQDLSLFNDRLVWQSVQTILDSATMVITILGRLGATKASVGAYWFSLYYIFNAALVVFAVGLVYSDEMRTIDSREETLAHINSTLHMAITTLPTIDSGNEAVQRCHGYLEKLRGMGLLRTSWTANANLPMMRSPAPNAPQDQNPGQDQVINHGFRNFPDLVAEWDLDMGQLGGFDFNDELL